MYYNCNVAILCVSKKVSLYKMRIEDIIEHLVLYSVNKLLLRYKISFNSIQNYDKCHFLSSLAMFLKCFQSCFPIIYFVFLFKECFYFLGLSVAF